MDINGCMGMNTNRHRHLLFLLLSQTDMDFYYHKCFVSKFISTKACQDEIPHSPKKFEGSAWI